MLIQLSRLVCRKSDNLITDIESWELYETAQTKSGLTGSPDEEVVCVRYVNVLVVALGKRYVQNALERRGAPGFYDFNTTLLRPLSFALYSALSTFTTALSKDWFGESSMAPILVVILISVSS